jgi:hypothetical protein
MNGWAPDADPNLMAGVATIILFTVLGVGLLHLTKSHHQTLPIQIKLFVYAIGLRFLLAVVCYQFGFVNVLGDEDGSGWYFGVVNYQQWEHLSLLDMPSVLLEAYSKQNKGYYYLLGGFFRLTGVPARFPAAALNCFFGALTVIFAYRAARTMFSDWVAEKVGWWTCLFPSLIIWSAQTVKEPFVLLLETVALYGCVKLKSNGFSLLYLALCGAAIALVMPFRFYAAYIMGTAVVLSLVLPSVSKGRMKIGNVIGVAILIVPLLTMTGILSQQQAQVETFDTKYIQKFRKDIAEGSGSGVEGNYDLTSSSGMAVGTAVGAAHLLLAPFPWQLLGGSARKMLTIPEQLFWWWLFFTGVVPGTIYAIKKNFNAIQPLLFFILGLGLLYSMMFGNVGLIYRQRVQLLPWLFIFGMVGLEQRRLKRQFAAQSAKMKTQEAGLRNKWMLPQTGINPVPVARANAAPVVSNQAQKGVTDLGVPKPDY